MKKIIFVYLFLTFYIFNSYTIRWIGRATAFLRDANEEESLIRKDEKFKEHKFFAASHNFDIGEIITVINIDTNKSIQVIISDHIRKPSGYVLFLSKEAADELEIEWQNDVYVMIEAKEKSISKDANINEISKVIEDNPQEQTSDLTMNDTLLNMILRHSTGYTPPSSIYRTPLEIITFEDKHRLRFRDSLKFGFYIKISTAYSEDEGIRRLKNFNQIFNSIIGYEEDGKYHIVMGPFEETDIDKELEKIKRFGYIDAIILKK